MTAFRSHVTGWKISQYRERAPGKTAEDSGLDARQGQDFTEFQTACYQGLWSCTPLPHTPWRHNKYRQEDVTFSFRSFLQKLGSLSSQLLRICVELSLYHYPEGHIRLE